MKTSQIAMMIVAIFLIQCNFEKKTNDNKPDKNDNGLSVNIDTSSIHKYYDIVLSLCDKIGEHNFTKKNTKFFEISTNEVKHTFVFATEIDCRFSGGSCGFSVSVYQKIMYGEYEILYENCAREIKKLNKKQNGFNLFELKFRDETKSIIYYDGNKFIAKKLIL